MGLFNRLGREVEQFRQTARTAADESEEQVCRDCGARLAPSYDECPRCDGDDLVPADAEPADAEPVDAEPVDADESGPADEAAPRATDDGRQVDGDGAGGEAADGDTPDRPD